MNGVQQYSDVAASQFVDFIHGRSLVDNQWETVVEMWAHGDTHGDTHGDHTDHVDGGKHADSIPPEGE